MLHPNRNFPSLSSPDSSSHFPSSSHLPLPPPLRKEQSPQDISLMSYNKTRHVASH